MPQNASRVLPPSTRRIASSGSALTGGATASAIIPGKSAAWRIPSRSNILRARRLGFDASQPWQTQ